MVLECGKLLTPPPSAACASFLAAADLSAAPCRTAAMLEAAMGTW